MKPPVLASVAALALLTSTALGSAIAPASAETNSVKFGCGTSQGHPATVVSTSRGNLPLIRWVSGVFGEEYPPEYRCKVVSPKFQKYYNDGQLNYLTVGYANKQPIVCVAATKGGPCTGVLFTLKANADPWDTLNRLMNVRVQAGGPLNESSAGSSGSDNQYIDINAYLNNAPVDASASINAEPGDTLQPAATPQPSNGMW
ncbi:MAG TPA: COP23 domain-containing protein [Stenomitos sp.]